MRFVSFRSVAFVRSVVGKRTRGSVAMRRDVVGGREGGRERAVRRGEAFCERRIIVFVGVALGVCVVLCVRGVLLFARVCLLCVCVCGCMVVRLLCVVCVRLVCICLCSVCASTRVSSWPNG